jgi:intracellular protein transport protein USO1
MMAEISNLAKANKNHLQDLKTAHDDYSAELSALAARLQRAEDRAKDAETLLKVAQQKGIEVSDSFFASCRKLPYLIYNG